MKCNLVNKNIQILSQLKKKKISPGFHKLLFLRVLISTVCKNLKNSIFIVLAYAYPKIKRKSESVNDVLFLTDKGGSNPRKVKYFTYSAYEHEPRLSECKQ